MAFRVLGTEAEEVATSATYALDSLETALRPYRVETAPTTTLGRDPVPIGEQRVRVDADGKTHLYSRLIGANSKPLWVEVGLRSVSGAYEFYANNDDTMDTADESILSIEQAGAGDASIQFELTGAQVYTLGIDNSDSDNFELYDVTAGTELLAIAKSTGDATFAGSITATGATVTGSAPKFFMMESDQTDLNWSLTVNNGNWNFAKTTDAKGRTTVSRLSQDGGFYMDNQGSNPGTVANMACIFSKDVSASAELFAMDEGGTATQISPHNPLTGEWWFHEYDGPTDTTRVFHLERMFNFLRARFPTEAADWYEEIRGVLTDASTLSTHKPSLARPSRALPDELVEE